MTELTELQVINVSKSSSPHYIDHLLREHGFKIHSRPERGEPTWRIQDEVYTQQEALYNVNNIR